MFLLLSSALSPGCKRSPDLAALPEDQESWCCTDICSAAKQIDGFPECANLFWPNERNWSLRDHGQNVAGQFISCAVTLRKALAVDPDVLGKTEIDDRLASGAGLSAADVRSCLSTLSLTGRTKTTHAYVFTYFDKRDEKKSFGAFPSQYYCDRERDELKKPDWTGNVSDCERVAAVR